MNIMSWNEKIDPDSLLSLFAIFTNEHFGNQYYGPYDFIEIVRALKWSRGLGLIKSQTVLHVYIQNKIVYRH